MNSPRSLKTKAVQHWLEQVGGVLTAKSAVVYRDTYFGNDIIAQNSRREFGDNRGYVPVELWIMSLTEAENTIRKREEGITKIRIFSEVHSLRDIQNAAESLIFGDHVRNWPLTKVLDIGGTPVDTSFGTREVPPIPAHVHPRKTEAYFFPPTDIPPYERRIEAITRIGLRGHVSPENVKDCLHQFGRSDEMYALLNEFPIVPMSGWTVREHVLHAPGPYLTFEIQRPQDDYNLASWKLGERLDKSERALKYEEHVLREIENEDAFLERVITWERNTDPHLKSTYFHLPEILDEGAWGRRYRIFFDMFYGEGWEIASGKTMFLPPKEVPQAGIVWSGSGVINGNRISQELENEFLVTPGREVTVENNSRDTLYIYTVEPIREVAS